MELSVTEAAEQLGISERQVRNQIKARQIHAIKVGKKWFVDEISLLAFKSKYSELYDNISPQPLSSELSKSSQTVSPEAQPNDDSLAIEKLRAFLLTKDFFARLEQLHPLPTPVARLKYDIFRHLGAGYYSYGKQQKVLYYQRARACLGAFMAIIASDTATREQLKPQLIEMHDELMPAMSALIRKMEKSKNARG